MSKSAIPEKIGKYEIRAVVGKGAMGVVYSAVDPTLGRSVAIKTMSISGSPHDAELRLRFLREARSAGRIQHPNIITAHELFEEGDTAYLVMELLEGASLSSLLRRHKKLSLKQKLSIIDQIAAGLSEAHAHGIVHRDLKPSNVFVIRSGIVKVLDFGVAKVGEGELTKAGTVFGTVEYMAPEQVRGQSVNPRADIFSLGVVAYEVLSGRNPFRADTLAASVFKIVSDNPEPLTTTVKELPVDVEKVVFRALSKNESDRFSSMDELRQALKQAMERAGLALEAPSLSEEDVVVTKDRGDLGAVSVEPRVSQWSHVAAQADQLEDLYQQGVEAFNDGDYSGCIDRMSQVLDDVPVHAMSLHFLAMSEEKLRKERLAPDAHTRATELLHAMRDAHRRGDGEVVMEKANLLLEIDRESLEARWYRRNAEARLRAVSVGHGARGSVTSARSVAGAMSQTGGRSFGYVPSQRKTAFSSPAAYAPEASRPTSSSSQSKGLWVLVGVGGLFIALVVVWLAAFQTPEPRAAAAPTALPGVRTSPFENMDEDGTIVLQVPSTPASSLSVERAIPTTIVGGEATKVGLFGSGFTETTTVRVVDEDATLLATTVRSETEIDIELLPVDGVDSIELLVEDRGARSSIELRISTP
jgi:serine/threonine protein kinase